MRQAHVFHIKKYGQNHGHEMVFCGLQEGFMVK